MTVRVEDEMRRGRQLTLQTSGSERSEVARKQKQIVGAGKRKRGCSMKLTFRVIHSALRKV